MRLADVVEGVCGMLDHMAMKSDVRMTLFVDPAIPAAAGRRDALRQVLINLIGNAIKFSGGREEPGGSRRAPADCDAGFGDLDLIVTDNGIGMDEATVARLFTPFTQADASTTRRFGGTGLGLAISSTLVQLMGGEIKVRSAPGRAPRSSSWRCPALWARRLPIREQRWLQASAADHRATVLWAKTLRPT